MKNTETIEETNAQPTTKIIYRDIKNPGTAAVLSKGTVPYLEKIADYLGILGE